MMQDQITNLSLEGIFHSTNDFEDDVLNKVVQKKIDSQSSDNEISYNQSNPNHKRKYFSKTDDQLLLNAVISKKRVSWNEIARYVPGKTPKQCRDRWANYLQPTLTFEPWSNSDDQLLVSLVNKYGTHWSKMKSYFQNRSTNAIKNRWRLLIKKSVKVLPIEQIIVSALTNNLAYSNQNKTSVNLNYFNSQNDFLTKSNNDQQSNNLKFYFLANDMMKENSYLKATSKNNSLILNEGDENLLKINDSDDEIITFTPEELDW